MRKILVLILTLSAIVSCTQAPPRIERLERRVVFRDDGFQREELMIYLRVSDPDDDNDPNEVTITLKDLGFQWRFQKEEWLPINIHGETMWGMPAILPYNGKKLPNALYIVTLADMAGQTFESSFRLASDRMEIDDVQWPRATFLNGRLEYSGTYSEPMLILRNEKMEAVEMLPVINGYAIPDNNNIAWWEIWINIGNRGSAIRMGPYSFTPKPFQESP